MNLKGFVPDDVITDATQSSTMDGATQSSTMAADASDAAAASDAANSKMANNTEMGQFGDGMMMATPDEQDAQFFGDCVIDTCFSCWGRGPVNSLALMPGRLEPVCMMCVEPNMKLYPITTTMAMVNLDDETRLSDSPKYKKDKKDQKDKKAKKAKKDKNEKDKTKTRRVMKKPSQRIARQPAHTKAPMANSPVTDSDLSSSSTSGITEWHRTVRVA